MHERFDYAKMYQDYQDVMFDLGFSAPDLEDQFDKVVDELKSKGFPHKIASAWLTAILEAGEYGDYVKAFNDKVYSEHL